MTEVPIWVVFICVMVAGFVVGWSCGDDGGGGHYSFDSRLPLAIVGAGMAAHFLIVIVSVWGWLV